MNQKIIEYIKHYVQLYAIPVGAMLLVTIVAGSLLTFQSHDQSLLYHARYGTCNNMFGYVGSSIAAILVYLFGTASYIFLMLILYLSLFLFRFYTIQKEVDRIVGMILLVISSSMFCQLYKIGWYEFSSFGGVVGNSLIRSLSYFDIRSKFLIAYSLLFASSVLILRFAHLIVARWIVKMGMVISNYCIQTDNVPARLIRGTATSIAYCCYGVQRVFVYCKKLLDGSIIKKSSVIEFERDEPVEQDVDQLMQDMFGQEFKSTNKKTKADHAKMDDIDIPQEQESFEYYDEHKEFSPAVSQENEKRVQKNEPLNKLYELPDVDTMLAQGEEIQDDEAEINQAVLDEQSAILEEKLNQFGVKGHIVRVHPGPVITMFEYKPESHIKLSKILALEDDLAMALQAISIRILAPIPGKPVVGFEVANKVRKPVLLSNLFHSKAWTKFDGHLPLILGEDTHGEHVVVDLANMPHVLIAGSTGSGKSVAVNCMLVSLLCAKNPEQVKLIIIDPKQLEFSSYEDIAHLLFPIVTDSKKAVPVLRWLVSTMEERYEVMAEHGVKNIFEYQKLAENDSDLEEMPFIVLIIDELADLMMTTGKDVEDLIARIAQMSRAAGIHMIVATQRPSVDVITGLIKVNFPNRISFKVTSKVDSRTILDVTGAERLLGKGDMLFLDAKDPEMKRVHGAYVSNKEIEFLVNHIKYQQDVRYLDLTELLATKGNNEALLEADQELYKNIVDIIKDYDEISISMIQRKFRIGYNRSARLIEALESEGLILPSDGGKMRRVVKS